MTRLAKWARVTSCHGIIDLYESTNVLQKLFWTVMIIAAFGAILFYQMSLVNYYMSIPTATQISKKTTSSLEFPIVTVCNQNIVSMQKYNKIYSSFNQSPLFTPSTSYNFLGYVSGGALYFPHYSFAYFPVSPVAVALEEMKFQELFNPSQSSPPNYDAVQFLKDISYSCSDMFIGTADCIFTMTPFNCCASAIPVQSDLGNCYQIIPDNLDKISFTTPNQIQPGVNSGLQMKLNYNISDAPEFPSFPVRDEGYQISIGKYNQQTI